MRKLTRRIPFVLPLAVVAAKGVCWICGKNAGMLNYAGGTFPGHGWDVNQETCPLGMPEVGVDAGVSWEGAGTETGY